jgi:hypothetical protein
VLKRRRKLIVALALLVPAAIFGGGYAYFYVETRGAPPPLELGPPSRPAAQPTPDGIWVSPDGGRLEIVGGWITRARLPPPLHALRLSVPVDLTHLHRGVVYRLRLPREDELSLLWRRNSLRVTAREGSALFRRRGS